jgi:hypothetical protein
MWIKTKSGRFINLNHAAEIVAIEDNEWRVFGPAGEELGVLDAWSTGPLGLGAELEPLVPATHGQEALVVWWWKEDGEFLVKSERRSIVAWRVSSTIDLAAPILAGKENARNSATLIINPGGTCQELHDRTWDSVEDAVAGIRARLNEKSDIAA